MNRSDKAFAWVAVTTLGASAAFLVIVALQVVRDAGRVSSREGLEYEQLLRAVDELAQLPEGREALRFEVVDVTVGSRTRVRYDSLIIVAGPKDVPSLGRGGFLYGEVRAYNAFQRERVALAADDPDVFERLGPHNPSIFRSYRRGDGSRGVTRTAAAWNRRVRSPFDDVWEGEVRAGDAHVERGLMSADATVAFQRPQRLARRVGRRRQVCEFDPRVDDVFAFCLSEARMPQAIFRQALDPKGHSRLVAGWNALSMDGERVAPGDSVDLDPGGIVQIAPLEPMVFGDYWQGVLSSRQWINGRMRRRGDVDRPFEIFAALGTRPVDPRDAPSAGAALNLAIDKGASVTLNEELHAFATRVTLPVDFGIVVLARASDGAVVALAEIGRRIERGRSRLLERIVPGSAVKPILAAAILSERPSLADLEIPARSGRVRSVLNAPPVPARRAFSTALNCAPPRSGRVDLRYFIRCSNNEYAASLLVASLTEPSAGDPSSTRARIPLEVPRGTLLTSPVSAGLLSLFDVPTDPVIADSLGRSRRVWQALRFSDGRPVRVPYEALPDESRPALLASGASEGTDLGLLYRYAYGAWENRWNALDLTNAFGRIVTDRRIQLTFAGADEVAALVPAEDLGLSEHDWYPELLAGLSDVGRDGTARGLHEAWRSYDLPPALYAKTGTLNEPEARGGSGLFVKSLLFAVGEEEDDGEPGLTCGIVGSVYLSFSEGPSRGSLPSAQLEFARGPLGRFLRDHWERFEVCQ